MSREQKYKGLRGLAWYGYTSLDTLPLMPTCFAKPYTPSICRGVPFIHGMHWDNTGISLLRVSKPYNCSGVLPNLEWTLRFSYMSTFLGYGHKLAIHRPLGYTRWPNSLHMEHTSSWRMAWTHHETNHWWVMGGCQGGVPPIIWTCIEL